MKKQNRILKVLVIVVCGLQIISSILIVIKIKGVSTRFLGGLNLVLLLIMLWLVYRLRRNE